jgi:TolA-binding protein
MKTAKQNGSSEIDRSLERDIARKVYQMPRLDSELRQVETGPEEMSADNLQTLLGRVAEVSTHEIETLIDQLHGLRETLVSDGVRIQNDIARYAELNQGAMQLAAIISDGVKKIPGASSISP